MFSLKNYSVLTVYNSMLYIYRKTITESTLFIDITKIIPSSYISYPIQQCTESNVSQIHSSPPCEQWMLITIGKVLPCCLKELKLFYAIVRRSYDFLGHTKQFLCIISHLFQECFRGTISFSMLLSVQLKDQWIVKWLERNQSAPAISCKMM